MSRRRINRRLLVLTTGILFLLALLFCRAFYVQIVAGASYRERAERQHVREFKIPARRGVIYERDGSELAISRRMVTIYATPYLIEDPANTAAKLAPILGKSPQEIGAKLEKPTGFEYLVRKVSPEIGEQVMKLELRGVGTCYEDKRSYPKGAFAPQLLGFVGTDNEGLAGLEKQYESVLAGEPGEREVVKDPSGRSLDILSDKQSKQGSSITLTIDQEIQYAAEQILAKAVKSHGAKRGSAVVLDPRNGEVLAMANAPLFDTNEYAKANGEIRNNAIVTDVYEPGSTMKVLLAAAALEQGVVTPDTVLTVASSVKVGGYLVRESHESDHGTRDLTFTEIIAESSNVGTIKVAQQLGKERIAEVIRRFGFTRKLGIDFPDEAAGYMPPTAKWSGSTIGNIPIGQGISATALQVAAAYATVANDGVAVQPHLLRDGKDHPSHRVISSEVATQLRQMLQTAVEKGTGKQARVAGYNVAGKTGTSQKALPKGGGYSKENYVASFAGMVPAESPRLVILVTVDEPKDEHMGAVVAAPVFAEIADFALKHLKIPPSQDQ